MQLVEAEPVRSGEELSVLDLLPERRGHLLHARGSAIEVDLHLDLPRGNRLRDRRRHDPLAHERERGAERRMPRERKLRTGREDPHAVAVAARLEDVRRLGEADLLRELRHELLRNGSCVGNDAQLVPGEPALGEDVDQSERDAHRGSISAATAARVLRTAGVAQW